MDDQPDNDTPSRREIAQFLLIGFRAGLIDVEQIVGWADAIVAEEVQPHFSIIEVAMAGSGGHDRIVSALSFIEGPCRANLPVELLLAYCWKRWETEPSRREEIAYRLTCRAARLLVSDSELAIKLVRFDNELYLAGDLGVRDVKQVMSEFADWLASYSHRVAQLPV